MIGRALIVAASAALIACSAFALDGFSSDPAQADDASTGDGGSSGTSNDGATGGGSDAGTDVATSGECAPTPGNFLVGQNEGFEQGCALWQTDRANLAASATSHCGKQACRVCPWQTEGSASLSVTFPKQAGERYVFSVWMRRDGDTSSIKASARIDMRENSVLDLGSSPLMTEWGVSTATVDIPEGFASDDIRIGVGPSSGFESGACFLIDDAALVRVKDAGL